MGVARWRCCPAAGPEAAMNGHCGQGAQSIRVLRACHPSPDWSFRAGFLRPLTQFLNCCWGFVLLVWLQCLQSKR